jgi:hypothetical protein
MPLNETSGNLTTDAFGGGVAVVPTYIEDVFSTWLYTGTSQPGSSSAYGYLVNNIDLLTKGGMIWTKDRSTNASGTNDHVIVDTVRGTGTWPAGIGNSPYYLKTNTTAGQATGSDMIQGVTTTGYYIGPGNTGVDAINTLNNNYASWTFRKQPKFFDVVTYTGNGTGGPRAIAHSLGSTPGCYIVKRTDGDSSWPVYHRMMNGGTNPQNYWMALDTTTSQVSNTGYFGTAPTSTNFYVADNINANGATYVAYLFAHDAGGFGATATDNVISCGSFTTDGSGGATVSLGYEPQWVMTKCSSTTSDWRMFDNMRGMSMTSDNLLRANTSGAESTGDDYINPTATGFVIPANGNYSASQTFIYIAIRRGPMKVPTVGTSVFSPNLAASQGQLTTGFPVDLGMWNYRTGYSENTVVNDRLRGVSSTSSVTNANNLVTSTTAAEAASQGTRNWNNTGLYAVTGDAVFYSFQRAPSFFDEVCFDGQNGPWNFNHNLNAVPELVIIKARNNGYPWSVWTSAVALTNAQALYLNTTAAIANSGGGTPWNGNPTSTVFKLGTDAYAGSTTGITYVAYLFATCAGVSKVGSYTGNGTTQTIDCGFTGGARFVLIKRTDATGGWYVYDTARGMTTLTDPYLLFNSSAAEVATLGSVTTVTTGFALNSTILAAINVSSATYIFLAIA